MKDEIKITYPRGWKVKIENKPPICGCCFEEPAVISGMCQGCYDANCREDTRLDAWWNEDDEHPCKYLYESHMGGIYTSNDPIDTCCCATCGDYDWFIGTFSTINEFWDLIEDKCNIKGSGGYNLQYIYPTIVEEFNLPDIIEYENYYQECEGFCCNSEQDIVRRIEELIGRKVERPDDDDEEDIYWEET